MAASARHLARSLIAVRPRSLTAVRPVAAIGSRLLSARTPIPEPKWKQPDNIASIIASDIDQATGLERAELLAELEGKNIFEEQPVGPFGTEASPVIVESINHERIIGCPGNCDGGDTRSSNDIRWFVVTDKKPYKCASCGQVFALKKIHGAEYKF